MPQKGFVMIYHVYMNGNYICPKCSGMMKKCGGETRFRCLDCNARFHINGFGVVDKEVILEEEHEQQGKRV